MTPALLLIIAALVFFIIRQWVRESRIWDLASREHRCALDFIAEEGCEMPHEFAACFLAGNHDAIARRWPNFFTFREQWMAKPEEEF
jgi:hypothetical protein